MSAPLAELPPAFPQSWYPLCRSADLPPGRVLRQRAFGVPLAVFRTRAGRPAALHAECIHMGADLSRGQVRAERLQCPLHHWEFGVSGVCEHIPAPEPIPDRARQTGLRCEEYYGLVFAFLGGEPLFDFPRFPDAPPGAYSRAQVMAFDTPYQVLAANSFDAQHFSSVHHRPLVEPPGLRRCGPYHLATQFRARVEGNGFHDRLLRGLGITTVELQADCWGGNTILAHSPRTGNHILFTLLPETEARTRLFVLNVLPAAAARAVPRPLHKPYLAGLHLLTLAFLKPDIAVLHGLRFRFGVLLPEADRTYAEWIKYWKALPRASLPQAVRAPGGISAAEAVEP